MAGIMTPELLRECEQADQFEPEREIPVIITLHNPTALAELEAKGVKISAIYEQISAVAGAATAADLRELARLSQVKRIEFDGQVGVATS